MYLGMVASDILQHIKPGDKFTYIKVPSWLNEKMCISYIIVAFHLNSMIWYLYFSY